MHLISCTAQGGVGGCEKTEHRCFLKSRDICSGNSIYYRSSRWWIGHRRSFWLCGSWNSTRISNPICFIQSFNFLTTTRVSWSFQLQSSRILQCLCFRNPTQWTLDLASVSLSSEMLNCKQNINLYYRCCFCCSWNWEQFVSPFMRKVASYLKSYFTSINFHCFFLILKNMHVS